MRSLRIFSLRNEVESPIEEFREDGKKNYAMLYFSGRPGEISHLNITPQRNFHDLYMGTQFSVTWLVMPCGNPLFRHFQNGSSIKTTRVVGQNHYSVKVTRDGVAATCILDPEHDWLPQQVRIEDSRGIQWNARKYARVADHWFPVEGTFVGLAQGGKTEERKFSLRFLRINESIPQSRFARPNVPDGVIVRQEGVRNGTYIKTSFGVSRKDAFNIRQEYVAKITKTPGARIDPVPTGTKLELPTTNYKFYVLLTTLTVAIAVFAVVLKLKDRRERKAL
jgi:hypothetical protein